MKFCEILEEFEFLSAKEKQKFLLKSWNKFHNEICDEDFIKEFILTITNNMKNETKKIKSTKEDIFNKFNGAKSL